MLAWADYLDELKTANLAKSVPFERAGSIKHSGIISLPRLFLAGKPILTRGLPVADRRCLCRAVGGQAS